MDWYTLFSERGTPEKHKTLLNCQNKQVGGCLDVQTVLEANVNLFSCPEIVVSKHDSAYLWPQYVLLQQQHAGPIMGFLRKNT
jgi:hypothetical protein